MRTRVAFLTRAIVVTLFTTISYGQIRIVVDHHRSEDAGPEFQFANVPAPSRSDAASKAALTLLDGRRDRNGGNIDKLHDGKIPTEEDQPTHNFFFSVGTDGGRIVVDLGSVIAVQQVNTYSWHPDTRGPQVYTLYVSDGTADGFNSEPKRGTDPPECGWTRVAQVDTRPKEGEGGGQYGVSVADPNGIVGKCRYLLFDIFRTETFDPFGNTFYSEIDVVEPNAPVVVATPAIPPVGEIRRQIVEAEGECRITIDTTEAPDLTEWARKDLAPVVREWYPRLVRMLPSEGYEAPRRVSITFSSTMRGVAATSGTRVRCAADWFRQNLHGEATGAVVHELAHVVQNYGIARRTNPNPTRTPGWLVEGICDYIRWFLYEPQTRGAEITARNIAQARYDASYRISANFLNWVTQTYDEEIVRKLNAAAREGKYNEDLWKTATGHTVQELGDRWKTHLERTIR